LEIELIFTAIADAMPDIAKVGDPVRLRSGCINGIKRASRHLSASEISAAPTVSSSLPPPEITAVSTVSLLIFRP
jgi:hypothetical protein